jgi:Rieske Fe-S protein
MLILRLNRVDMKLKQGFIFISMIFIFSLSCGKGSDHQSIPEVPVDLYLDISSTIYIKLSNVGGYEYLSGGYKGLIVYRVSMEEFVAYDRTCPYHPYDKCALIEMNPSGIILKDTCCGSQFNILDGSVSKGPAEYPLKKYQTIFDGQILQISN